MNKVELSGKLAGIAETLTGKDEALKERGATEMLKLAKELVSFDPPAEMEKSVEALAKLAKEFKDGQATLIAKIADMEKQVSESRKLLVSFYKGWEVQSGYRSLRAEVMVQAEKCMVIGDTLSDLSGELTVGRRESEQESYKEKYNILVSTLNEAELKKYSRILNAFFRKQMTEVDAGMKELNGTVKQWHESAEAIAEERGIALPKAASDKTAGFIGDIVDALKSIIPDLIKRVQTWATEFFAKIRKNGEVLDVMDAKLGRMVAKARSVL
jgi:hypothetical protein